MGNNNISKIRDHIGTFVCTYWDYDNNTRLVSVTIDDDLLEWQEIYVDGFDYNPQNPQETLPNRSMADLYKWLYEKTPTKYNMISFEALDNDTRNILEKTTIETPFLKSNYLWQ
jgi:hypothetical protein